MTDFELHTEKMLTSLASDIAAVRSMVEAQQKAIFGNGRPGLLDRMSQLEATKKTGVTLAGIIWNIVTGLGSFAGGLAIAWMSRQ